ncbi:hypothetical protein [Azotobacter beijerinckii]|uniref:hypothetical protein n=1 Tax=Azotobacter beijerinckii TaxID=170623 RepID=UPI001130FF0B|nr:hypothetical protein [Azotobacter beijerinckii]
MEADEKFCQFCAEVVKEQAVKCKHCGSDLTKDEEGAKRKSSGWKAALLGSLAVGVSFLGYGAYLSSTPEGKERAKLRAAIELCRKEEGNYQGGLGERRIITGACEKLESDLASGGQKAVTHAGPVALSVGQKSKPVKLAIPVRNGPDFSFAKVIRSTRGGEILTVISMQDGLAKVSGDNGLEGWVIPEMLDW